MNLIFYITLWKIQILLFQEKSLMNQLYPYDEKCAGPNDRCSYKKIAKEN